MKQTIAQLALYRQPSTISQTHITTINFHHDHCSVISHDLGCC